MSTEKKKEQQLLEDVTAQPAVQSSYSTAGLNSRKEVENALTNAVYTPGQSVTDAAADLRNWQQNRPGKYESAYQGRIEDLIGQLLERNSFQYSYAQDPLYRQYEQLYTQNAHNASADAAAQAAAHRHQQHPYGCQQRDRPLQQAGLRQLIPWGGGRVIRYDDDRRFGGTGALQLGLYRCSVLPPAARLLGRPLQQHRGGGIGAAALLVGSRAQQIQPGRQPL